MRIPVPRTPLLVAAFLLVAAASRAQSPASERMVLVSGEMHVSYRGQEKVVLKPGLHAYGPAKASHGASCVSSEPCVLFIAFESPVDAVAGAGPPK